MRAKEFIVETAEEIRELESLSGMIADKVMPIFSKSPRDYARIIKLKYLNLPQFKSPAVNDIIANASISMYRWWPGDTLGSWHNIEQNVTMRKDMLDNRNKFVSTLAHELTHALDYYKGVPRQYSKMTTKSKATAGDEYENYLRLQHEIDARLTQALLEIGSNIKELQDIDQLFSAPGEPTPKEQQVLSNAISWAFGKHQIAQLFPQGAQDPKYRRLLTRAYKFYSTPAVAPQATEPTLVQRAKNWIGLNVLAEDANPARQAAKAIWNKKHHKKPKGVAEDHSAGVKHAGLVMTMQEGEDGFKLRALSPQGKVLGFVEFSYDTEGMIVPEELEVDDRYRGQGIAAAMYDYVKSQGYKIRRSGQQTAAGAGFWAKHRGEDVRVWEQQSVAENSSNNIPTIGINVRSDGNIDYASLIVDGKKKYESRKTDSLRPYVGKTVGIVRTGNGPAVAIGQVTIGEPIVVDAEKFNRLRKQHLVPQGSKFDIDSDGKKYLYPMIDPVRWDYEKTIKHTGIVSRKIQEQGVAETGSSTKVNTR